MAYKPKSEYIVAALNNGDFTVTKFEESDSPTATYTLHPRSGRWQATHPMDQRRYKCDCRSGIHHIHVECRHIDMVEEFKATGKNYFER